jgi:hypothetical protein
VFASSSEWPNRLRRRGGGLYTPEGDLPVGVLESQKCPGCGLGMSDKPLWNPAWESDMSDSVTLIRNKAERLDMSEKPL